MPFLPPAHCNSHETLFMVTVINAYLKAITNRQTQRKRESEQEVNKDEK